MCTLQVAMRNGLLLLLLLLPSFMLTFFVEKLDFNSYFCHNFITLLFNFHILYLYQIRVFSEFVFSRCTCETYISYIENKTPENIGRTMYTGRTEA
jgi:hypothetical protein